MEEDVTVPEIVSWETTYACPLRCIHCFTDSGRRPARQAPLAVMRRIAERIAAARPRTVELAGGEPLLVDGILEIAGYLASRGIEVGLFTSGFGLDEALADEVARVFHRVHVSVDAGTAELHDRVRGRSSSFAAATAALERLAAAKRSGRARDGFAFGIDATLLRSTLASADELCAEVAHRFDGLAFVALAPAVPSGLASRAGVAEHELLDFDETACFRDADTVRRWERMLPAGVQLWASDNEALLMRPGTPPDHPVMNLMSLESDGAVRALPMYLGTVGNVLETDVAELWARAIARRSDEFVRAELARVATVRDWAAAARAIDRRFGAPPDLQRIDARKPFLVAPERHPSRPV
jgi:MoaA/NifB/PqqE/SkfB family radical SAM enzyme